MVTLPASFTYRSRTYTVNIVGTCPYTQCIHMYNIHTYVDMYMYINVIEVSLELNLLEEKREKRKIGNSGTRTQGV